MVATWNPAASSAYYARQTAYYAANGVEPNGLWFAPSGDHGLVDEIGRASCRERV